MLNMWYTLLFFTDAANVSLIIFQIFCSVSEEERDKEYRIKFNAAGKSYNLKM